jgi:hypothetical protein
VSVKNRWLLAWRDHSLAVEYSIIISIATFSYYYYQPSLFVSIEDDKMVVCSLD